MGKMLVGGQAVIEGIMMRSPKFYAIAIRRKSGDIDLKIERFETIANKYKILSKPFLRGMVALVESMILGMKTLSYSADIYSLDYDLEEEKKNEAEGKKTKPKKDNKNNNMEIIISIILSFVFGIFLFVLVPLWLTNLFKMKWSIGTFSFNIIDGIIRLIIFLLYVYLISFMKDIRRVFEYHGAEHKAVFTYENDEELNIENTQKHSTLHPRCGTNFMFIVIVLSILIISLFKVDSFYLKFLVRILVLPLIAGISYEVLRFLGRNFHKKWAKIFFSPGLYLQKITTKQPDDSQVEIALVALKAVLGKEQEEKQEKEEKN